MLMAAQLYKEELKRKLVECWYKPEYDYYFLGDYHEFTVPDNTDWRRDFVCLNSKGEITGYFSYHYNEMARSLSQFGLISFTGNGTVLVRDCICHIEKLIGEGLRRMEWWAVDGNPANRMYEEIIDRYGGTIAGHMHECNYFAGKYHDSILYEVLF